MLSFIGQWKKLVNNWRSMLATDTGSFDSLLVTERVADIIFLVLIFGIAIGTWSFLGFLSKLSEMDRELKLLNVIRDGGKIRLDNFTISCSVHVVVAKWYLNSKARQLNALQEVDEFSDRIYLFGEAKRKFLQENLALLSQNGNAPTPLNSPQRAADSTRLA